MKGASLAITMIVLLSLAVAVIFFSVQYFNSQKHDLDKIQGQRYIMECCQKWVEDGCNPTDVTQTSCSLPGCSDLVEIAKKYGFGKDGVMDVDKLRDFCNCPQGG